MAYEGDAFLQTKRRFIFHPRGSGLCALKNGPSIYFLSCERSMPRRLYHIQGVDIGTPGLGVDQKWTNLISRSNYRWNYYTWAQAINFEPRFSPIHRIQLGISLMISETDGIYDQKQLGSVFDQILLLLDENSPISDGPVICTGITNLRVHMQGLCVISFRSKF